VEVELDLELFVVALDLRIFGRRPVERQMIAGASISAMPRLRMTSAW